MNEIKITDKDYYSVIKEDFISQSGLNKETFAKEVSFAIQILNSNPYLQKCDRGSVLKAVLNVAQTNLSLNPVLKYAYMVPRKVRRGSNWIVEACLEPSYVGLAKLLTDTGSVLSLSTQIVYEGDEIEINLGSANKVEKHTPYMLTGKEKGSIKAVYSLATLPDGSKHVEIMSYKDVLDIRERSESYKAYRDKRSKSCIWISDEAEMIRKTVIKRHCKYLPKSHGFELVAKAVDLDNKLNGFLASDGQVTFILSLIHTAEINDDEKSRLEDEAAFDLSEISASNMIAYLQERQPLRKTGTQKEIASSVQTDMDKDEFYKRD